MSDHEQWITEAVELARAKRYDEARELALRVIREDGRNAKALWIVASTTNSLPERRNALKALLRVQPDNVHARQLLQSVEQEFKTSSPSAPAVARSLDKPSAQPHVLLYAVVAIAVIVIFATVIVAARL